MSCLVRRTLGTTAAAGIAALGMGLAGLFGGVAQSGLVDQRSVDVDTPRGNGAG